MKNLELGLTDIERNQKEATRRARNCLKALLVISMFAGLLNFIIEITYKG